MKKIALLIASVSLASSVFAADASAGAKKAISPTPTLTASAPAPKVLTSQQNKMVTCNKSATGMKGDERKAFMSNCLKKTPSTEVTPTTSTPAVSSVPALAPLASSPAQAASKPKSK